MPDYIGNIAVPEFPVLGVFPVKPDVGWGLAWEPEIAIHQFGSGDAKVEQRFLLGTGAKKFIVRKAALRDADRTALRDFWESHKGPYGAFYYDAPNDDGAGTTRYVCRFAVEPLSWQMLTDWVCSVGVTLIEIPQVSPEYLLNATLNRFPSAELKTALLAQTQQIIPLIKVTPRCPMGAVHVADLAETRVPGNTAPWEFTGGMNAAYPFLDGTGPAWAPPVVLATGLNPGDDITIPTVTGGVAWDNLGFGSYLWAPPAGTLDSHGWGDYTDVYTSGMHDGKKYPCYYANPRGGVGLAGLVGAFTDDAGNVVKVVAVGAGGTFRSIT